jgi:type II pantothenate kinase
MFNINADDLDVKIPLDTIGVDMGQSLSKIAYYQDNGFVCSLFSAQNDLNLLKDILNSKKNQYSSINFTGGKSFKLFQSSITSFKTKLLNEFEANVRGIEILNLLEKKEDLAPSLIVTIGTGTSMVSKKDKIRHVGGTAIGGGFFMGLIKVLFKLSDFREAINLAKKGSRYNVDLKVSDIYDPDDNRVDLIFREFTAASFGKIDSNYDIKNIKKEDAIHSLICMIGENIGTIANLMAEVNNLNNIVFCGGFLKENRILKKILSLLSTVNKKKAIFLKNSEFAAAIGALFL